MSSNLTIIVVALLAAFAVGTLLYAVFYTSIRNEKKAQERMSSLKNGEKKQNIKQAVRENENRRKIREDSLKSLEKRRKKDKRAENPDMETRLVQAGLGISLRQFYIISAVVGIVCFLVMLILGLGLPISAGIGFVAGFGLPRWFVNFKRNRRFRAFILIFPNAIDIIVRGIRSGLPLNDCLRVIANDADEPVKSEFRKLIESTQLGISVPEACERLYKAIPTPETNFFSIVIAIQSSAGGNLAEALGNLSKVLRERRKMSDKIKAVSMEAKASAMIIGSLPFIVALLVWLSTPNYLNPLFYEPTGHKILFFCAMSMGFGIMIMKKMINFKF